MRNIFLLSLCLFAGCIACGFNSNLCNADVYVLTNSDNSVVGLSEQNDMIIPKGSSVAVIKGNIANLPISGDSSLYNFSKGAFTLNATKVQAQQASQQAVIAKQTSEATAKASAVGKLKGLGLTDEEIKALLQ